jgi:hypothetical protein
MQWISLIILGHPECWTSCRMVQDPRRSIGNLETKPQCVFPIRRASKIERGNWEILFVGGDIGWIYRFPRSDETWPRSLCVGRETAGDDELFRIIERHQHGSMLSYGLRKSPIVLSRRPDHLADRTQNIQNRRSFNFVNAICNVLKDRNDGLYSSA